MCDLFENLERPTSTPLAVSSQCGENNPENAGTKYTSPLSFSAIANASTSELSLIMFKLSLNH